MYHESVFCFPRIVSNVLSIRGKMNLLVALVVVCQLVHLLLLRKRSVLVV